MTVLIVPLPPVTLSSTRGLGEPLPAPGPIGHPSHSGEPWVEVPGVHTSHQATPGRSPFHRVACALLSTQSAPPYPSEGPEMRDLPSDLSLSSARPGLLTHQRGCIRASCPEPLSCAQKDVFQSANGCDSFLLKPS